MRLSDEEFIALVTAPSERRNLEFKPGGHRSGYHLAQVARAALAMANLRDGGVIILGVEEPTPGVFVPQGIADTVLASWSNNDDVVSTLTAYADPAFSIERDTHDFEGRQYVVIQVREFDTVPILCKKGYKDPNEQKTVLQTGWCYIRGTRKPESIPVQSLAEMRELFDLATEKGVRRFISQARAAGLNLSGAAIPTDDDHFEQEYRDLELNQESDALLAKLQSKGYWRVVIRPTTYERNRIADIGSLFPLIFQRSVNVRGWEFPQVNRLTARQIGLNWVGTGADYHHFFEIWQFFQSGQFVDYLAMSDDWRGEEGRRGIWKEEDTGIYLPISDTIITFVEIFEFAARLALTEPYGSDSSVHIEVTLNRLKNRLLYVDDSSRNSLHRTHKATIESFPYIVDVAREDLIADPRMHALAGVGEVFKRFDWQPGITKLRSALDELP